MQRCDHRVTHFVPLVISVYGVIEMEAAKLLLHILKPATGSNSG
jgi:hypothetical protein